MRRKSERTAATKKAKVSPEKKMEKVKRTRSKRTRKQSASSENESGEESSPVQVVEDVEITEQKPPSTPTKEVSPEETQDQVWQVKTSEGSGDVGEIHKLKICLTRPPSTPERADRSPRSKRKHSRATSSSDTPSVEGVEEKRKSRHRSKRSTRESKDESEKNNDSQGDEVETESEQTSKPEKAKQDSIQATQAPEVVTDETPVSTTNEENKEVENKEAESSATKSENTETDKDTETQNKASDADTTVNSPKNEVQQPEINTVTEGSPVHTSDSVEKSEVLEIHEDESKSGSLELPKGDGDHSEGQQRDRRAVTEEVSSFKEEEVSIKEDKGKSKETQSTGKSFNKSTNDNDVVESSQTLDTNKKRTISSDYDKDKEDHESRNKHSARELERSDSTHSTQEDMTNTNSQTTSFTVSRKRRWGSRPSKITTQKSITISTDILKEIIPDVKPTEFEEVIEEKKQKRIEVTEKIERPVLPKIVIDNSESVEKHRKEMEDKDKENVKGRDTLGANRRISIVKENESILARPPSPPRHKQSNILFISNLVRPFTLPQLKNLLQRTGRIVENGFWIDKIKSKCFVKYETEDQAVETRHALHGVTWPVSNPKTLQVDFSTEEAFDNAKSNEETENAQTSTIPGTVEDWLREQDMKRERGELDKPWERKTMREWDVGKNDKEKEKDRLHKDERPMDKRRHRSIERSPEPAKKFKKKEEEAPAKLLDDLFRKTKTTPCIYWLPLSAETIAIKEEQRRQHMAEHERRLQELRRTHRRH